MKHKRDFYEVFLKHESSIYIKGAVGAKLTIMFYMEGYERIRIFLDTYTVYKRGILRTAREP